MQKQRQFPCFSSGLIMEIADGAFADEIFGRRGSRCAEGVDEDQLDLHFLGNDAFDIDRAAVSGLYIISEFRKPCQIGRKFNENSVGFHTADDAHHRLSRIEAVRILLPGAEKLLVGQADASPFAKAAVIAVSNGAKNFLPRKKAVGGMGDTGHGNAVNGNEGGDPAPNIAKGAERLQMGHLRRENIADLKMVQILFQAFFLRFLS